MDAVGMPAEAGEASDIDEFESFASHDEGAEEEPLDLDDVASDFGATAAVDAAQPPPKEPRTTSRRPGVRGEGDDARERRQAALQRADWLSAHHALARRERALEQARRPSLSRLLMPYTLILSQELLGGLPDALRQLVVTECGAAAAELSPLVADMSARAGRARAAVGHLRAVTQGIAAACGAPTLRLVAPLTAAVDAAEVAIGAWGTLVRPQGGDPWTPLEHHLSRDVADAAAKVDAWGRGEEPGIGGEANDDTRPRRRPLPPPSLLGRRPQTGGTTRPPPREVAAYDDFVAVSGPTGGWHPADRAAFLAALTAVGGGYDALVTQAATLLPGMTRAAVLAHARWDSQHADLLARKKAAVAAWRCARDAQRTAATIRAGEMSHLTAGTRPLTADADAAARREAAWQIAQWRTARAQRAAAAAAQQEGAAAAAAARDAARDVAAESIRAAVRARRLMRAAEAEADHRAAEAAKAAERAATKLTSAPTVRLHARAQAFLHGRRELIARKAAPEAARAAAQAAAVARAAPPPAPRDPLRLLQPTRAVEARAAADSGPGALFGAPRAWFAPGGGVGRSTPSWRTAL